MEAQQSAMNDFPGIRIWRVMLDPNGKFPLAKLLPSSPLACIVSESGITSLPLRGTGVHHLLAEIKLLRPGLLLDLFITQQGPL